MISRTLALLVFAWMFVAGGAKAQGIAGLPVGVRVRITVADSARQSPFFPRAQSVIGNVARATSDTLWLQVAGPDTVRVPRGTLRRLEVSRGVSRARSAVEHGVTLGAMSVLIFAASADDAPGHRWGLGISAIAAGVGAALGAWRPYERWRRVR